MTILDAQPRGPPSGLSAQVQPPPTNLELRLQLLQGEGTGLPSPGPGCARCGEEPAALPSATPAGACRGLSWPLPGRGFPLPHRAVVQPAGFSLPLPRHGDPQLAESLLIPHSITPHLRGSVAGLLPVDPLPSSSMGRLQQAQVGSCPPFRHSSQFVALLLASAVANLFFPWTLSLGSFQNVF